MSNYASLVYKTSKTANHEFHTLIPFDNNYDTAYQAEQIERQLNRRQASLLDLTLADGTKLKHRFATKDSQNIRNTPQETEKDHVIDLFDKPEIQDDSNGVDVITWKHRKKKLEPAVIIQFPEPV